MKKTTAGAGLVPALKATTRGAPTFFWIIFFMMQSVFAANEVIEDTHTKVVVKKHPKTGMPYVSITPENAPEPAVMPQTIKRPDYRMLDPKIKSGQIPYEGPTSSRKKVYVFAATIASLGAVGGTAIIVAAPAATGAEAAGGAGAYAAAGGAVMAGTLSTGWLKTRPDPNKDPFIHESKSKMNQEMEQKIASQQPCRVGESC